MELIIDYSNSFRNIEKLKSLDLNNSNAYNEILELLSETIVPHPILTMPAGKYLYRARKNESKPFITKEEISYNKDASKIKEYGRANNIGQSLFYAGHKDDTAIFETSSLFKDGMIAPGLERFTLGRWYVKKSIDVIGMVCNKEAMMKEESLKNLYLKVLNLIGNDANAQRVLEFFSKEFSRNIKGDKNNYKLSCAYFNFILNHPQGKRFKGIVYPSVENEYRDLNVALLPDAVDDSLILDMVTEFEADTIKREISQIGLGDVKKFNLNAIKI